MKKRLFTSVLSALLFIVLSVFGLVGCGGKEEEEKKITLNVTAKELVVGESFTLTATTTPAEAEVIWSTSDEAIVTVEEGVVTAISVGTATVTAENDTVTATCEITVKAAPVIETESYTVVFKNGNTEMKSMEVAEGAAVVYSGPIPSKAPTEQYEYTFSGWSETEGGETVDLATVTLRENKTFYAVFTESVRSYNVVWNIDGTATEEQLAYGAMPEYKGVTPTKPTVGNTSYTFLGWATTIGGEVLETLPTVTGNVTYYAVFKEVTAQVKFTVTWKNGETELEKDVNVEYEAMPTYDGATPVKEPTTESDFVFVGWAASIGGAKLEPMPEVTADATYYAVFEPTARKYTITWMIEGVEKTSECAYGTVPAYTETPVKEDSEICSFKFVGWALTEDGAVEETLPTVSGVATYYAVFEVDQIFESPKFVGGKIEYSAKSQEIFLPDGLLGEGVTIVKAVLKKTALDRVTVYENGVWAHDLITLTEEELKGNFIGARSLEVELSDGAKYSVDMNVYAGIIDEFADFPKFFNNTAVPSEFDATAYPAVAPNVYGYYIVTKDLGAYTFDKEKNTFVYEDELAFEQTEATDYQKTNGFNGVLDGQGHTLKFKLTKGGLVGLVLGNAVIKNLGVLYEDATTTYYGVFGYITNGNPEIRNCYIERTNNHYQAYSVFGIMARPNTKLIMHNTVVYGYNTSNNSAKYGNMWINETSTNVYVIHARGNAMDWVNVQNFTKVFTDAVENGSREVLLSEIEDVSKFDDNYWYKENGKLIWKGFALETVTWVKGEETTTETVTKDGWIMYTQTLPENTTSNIETVEYYWSTSEDGEAVKFSDRFQVKESVTYYMVEKREICYYTVTWVIDGVETTEEYEYNATITHEDPVKEEDEYYIYEFKGWSTSADGELVEFGTVTEDITYYAVFDKTAKVVVTPVNEAILYSSADDQLFLPAELTLTIDETVKISSADGNTVYYENGSWLNNFDLTDEQIKANSIGVFDIAIKKGSDVYTAKVKSYAGVIDELSDFPAFFNNTAVPSEFDAATYPAVAPNVYGYYIVTKDLGSATDELAMTQTEATDYQKTNGFNGVLDGAGNTLRFKLMSGGLVGMVLGNAVIKNIRIVYEDGTYDSTTKKGGYGVFGYITNGSPEIRNSYIERTNNLYHQGSVFGIMARPNTKLILHNTAVHANTTSNASGWYSNMWISSASTNAYLIYARSNATGWSNVTNFTEVTTTNTLTNNLSSFDTNYWRTDNNKLDWKGLADMSFSSVVKVTI